MMRIRTLLCNKLMTVMLACLGSSASLAQELATSARPTPPKVAKKPDAKLSWNALGPAQQQALAPLAGEWDRMEQNRKEKWLVIANKFARMGQAEQHRMQERMRDWVKLTPAQRHSVRANYARAKKLDAAAQWKEYQQLPEEQKKKLSQARLPKRVAALPATPHKAAPARQLPAPPLPPQQALAQPAAPGE